VRRLIVAITLLCLVPAGFLAGEASAAEFFEKVGTYDGQFLKIPIGARATGMGAAFVAVADDASAVYWNPAGLARLQGNIVSVHHVNWVADANMTQGTYVFSLGFLPGMLAFNARSLYDTGYRSLKIGMEIQNMGSELSYIDTAQSAKIPILFRVGGSINLYQSLDHQIVMATEFSHPPDNNERLNWGGEYVFKEFFFLRGGYNFGYDAETFSGGLGVKFPTSLASETRFDYSYTDLSDLDAAHRFSLEISF
jgi:hypothetical protein